MADDFIPSGGTALVFEWLEELAKPAPRPLIWTALDEGLRLVFTQAWMIDHAYDRASDRDQRAADLADAAGTHALFPQMLDDLIAHLQGVYEDLDGRPGLVSITDIVGVDMELVVVASEDLAGTYPEGTQLPAHCFITKIVDGDWKIAANARRMPVPGWPPSEAIIPGLAVDR